MPKLPDPFEDPVPDDDDLSWPDDPPAAPVPDLFDLVDDDEGTEDLEAASAPASDDLAEVDDEASTDDPFDAPVPSDEWVEAHVTSPGLPVVPWRTTATINGVQVPAILSPSMPTSTWRGGPESDSGQFHTIELAGVTVQTVVDVRPGAALLVLGRDVLEDRVLISV